VGKSDAGTPVHDRDNEVAVRITGKLNKLSRYLMTKSTSWRLKPRQATPSNSGWNEGIGQSSG